MKQENTVPKTSIDRQEKSALPVYFDIKEWIRSNPVDSNLQILCLPGQSY